MSGIHDVGKVRFPYGDYEVTVELDYWESMATKGHSEAYRVSVYAMHTGDKHSHIHYDKDAKVWQRDGFLGLFGEKHKIDVAELVQEAWNEGRQKIDRVSNHTSGEVTVDFEVAAEAAEESSQLTDESYIERELSKLADDE